MSKSLANRLPLLVLIILLVVLITYLQWPAEVNVQEKKARIVSVKTTQVAKAEFKNIVEAIGTARANEQVEITSKYSNIVEGIYFDDGLLVKKGDLLIKLSNKEEGAKVKELQANLAESVAQLNRFQDLLKKKATSSSQVDQQDAKTKAIAAQLLSAKTKLDDLTIKAPFDGVLGFRQISVGAYINSGDVITHLDDLSVIKVEFSIPERFLTTVKKGQRIAATTVAYHSVAFTGKIIAIDSRIDPATRTLKVRAEIPNPMLKLRPGMLLTVQVITQVDNVMQLPESAIIPIENQHFIYTVKNNIASKKAIVIGRRQPGIVEVLSGVGVGEHVVIEGALKLRDGVKVSELEL